MGGTMKNYGNFIAKYVSAEKSPKYAPILANSNNEYNEKQLADLKRFLKEDFAIGKNRDNQGLYNSMVEQQKEVIEAEIARLEGQVGSIKRAAAKIKAAKEVQEKAAKHIAEKEEAEKKERARKSKVKQAKAKEEAEARAEVETGTISDLKKAEKSIDKLINKKKKKKKKK